MFRNFDFDWNRPNISTRTQSQLFSSIEQQFWSVHWPNHHHLTGMCWLVLRWGEITSIGNILPDFTQLSWASVKAEDLCLAGSCWCKPASQPWAVIWGMSVRSFQVQDYQPVEISDPDHWPHLQNLLPGALPTPAPALPQRLLLLSFIRPRNFLVQCRNIKTQNFSYLIFVKYKITNSLLVYADLATFCDRAANGWEKSKQTSLLGSRLVSDYNNDRIILVYRAAQL